MKPINWHRMFGLLLTDFFTETPFVVELEKDLSLKRQLLDVVVLRKEKGRFEGRLPDGFDKLTTHNLITFKSHREMLDDWALKELTGHYVNYRKQVSPSFNDLLPEGDFQLFAVCSRQPRDLAGAPDFRPIQEGVFDIRRGTDVIRVIVLAQLPEAEHNAVLHLLSAAPDKVQYGVNHYTQRSSETSSVLNQLFEGYQKEGVAVPYTMEDFKREYLEERLKEATPEQLLRHLSLEERLQGLSPDQRLQGLSQKEIDELLRQHQGKTTTSKRKKKR